MKVNLKNKYFKLGLTLFLVIISCILFYYLLFHGAKLSLTLHKILNVCMPIIWGLVLGYLLTPILNSIEKYTLKVCEKFKIKTSKKREKIIRISSIFITWLLAISFLYCLFSMMISQIIPSVITIVHDFDTYIKNVSNWLTNLLEDNPTLKNYTLEVFEKYSTEIEGWLNGTIIPKFSELLKTVSLSIIGFLRIIWDFIIGFIISIYVMGSKETFAGQGKKIIYGLFERETANEIIQSMRFTHRTFIGFISGKIIDSIIIGLLCFIGVSLLNLPYPALISVIIGVTNIIPFFGPFLGAIPSAILILLVDFTHPLNCLYFIIFIFFLQQLDGNIIGPKILGESTGLSSFWVIFSITIFGGFMGFTGMIIGVPTFAIIYAGIKGIINKKLRTKNMSLNTKEYIPLGTVNKDGHFDEYKPEPNKNRPQNKSLIISIIQKIKAKKKTGEK